jgi:hypothetical protein
MGIDVAESPAYGEWVTGELASLAGGAMKHARDLGGPGRPERIDSGGEESESDIDPEGYEADVDEASSSDGGSSWLAQSIVTSM